MKNFLLFFFHPKKTEERKLSLFSREKVLHKENFGKNENFSRYFVSKQLFKKNYKNEIYFVSRFFCVLQFIYLRNGLHLVSLPAVPCTTFVFSPFSLVEFDIVSKSQVGFSRFVLTKKKPTKTRKMQSQTFDSLFIIFMFGSMLDSLLLFN